MKETFAYYETTPEIIEKLENETQYHILLDGHVKDSISGFGIKHMKYVKNNLTHILLPFSPPKDISDEEIREAAIDFSKSCIELGYSGDVAFDNFKIGAEWHQSQLAGKQPDSEFIIQKMNELVNDLNNRKDSGVYINNTYPDEKEIVDFINDWADKNLMEGKDSCCTPKGQIKRYLNCIGCDRKPNT